MRRLFTPNINSTYSKRKQYHVHTNENVLSPPLSRPEPRPVPSYNDDILLYTELKGMDTIPNCHRDSSYWKQHRSDSVQSLYDEPPTGIYGVTLVNNHLYTMRWLKHWRVVAYSDGGRILGDADVAWQFLCAHREPESAQVVACIRESWTIMGVHFKLLYRQYYNQLITCSNQLPTADTVPSGNHSTASIVLGGLTGVEIQALHYVLAMLDIKLIDATTVLLCYSYNTVMKQNAIDAVRQFAAIHQPAVVLMCDVENFASDQHLDVCSNNGVAEFLDSRWKTPGIMVLATSRCFQYMERGVFDQFRLLHQ
jgi:hypothetical protein